MADKPWHKDGGKPRVDLMPPLPLFQVGHVLAFGLKKYGARNWEDYAAKWSWGDLLGSTLRHVFAWMAGEDLDPESKLPHLAHALCDLMMLLQLVLCATGQDDRTKLRPSAYPQGAAYFSLPAGPDDQSYGQGATPVCRAGSSEYDEAHPFPPSSWPPPGPFER